MHHKTYISNATLFPLFTTNRTCPIVTLQKGKHVASTRSDAKQPLKKFIELEIGGLTNAFVLISANGNVSQIIRCDWEFSFKRIRTDIFMRFLFIIKSHYCQQWVHRIRYFRDCKTQDPIKGRLRIPLIWLFRFKQIVVYGFSVCFDLFEFVFAGFIT